MTSLSLEELILAALIVFTASLLRGLSGFGFGLLAAPLFSLIWQPVHAVALSILFQMLSAVPAFLHQHRDIIWPIVVRMMTGAALGVLPGMALLLWLPEATARLAMAAILLVALVLLATGVQFRRPLAMRHFWVVGMVSGVTQMVSGAAGPPVIISMLASKHLTPVAIRATLTGTLFFVGVVGLVPLVGAHSFDFISAADVLLLCIPMVAGYGAGNWLFFRIADVNYRRFALGVLFGAVLLALKPVFV
jgi:uncharacterized membrane protein YfcA